MEQVTVRVPLRLKAELEREAAERGVTRSEHIRDVLDRRGEVDRLRERLERREARIDDLEEQLARRSDVEEQIDVLAKRVEEREAAADAPFFVRWRRWWRRRS